MTQNSTVISSGVLDWSPTARVLAETLDGGQAFRWRPQTDGSWEGRWAGQCVRLSLAASGKAVWTSPHATGETAGAVRRYFGLETDWAALADRLPLRSDPVLRAAVERFPSLRILRQPFGETLLGFLCSSTKQIVQIRRMCDDLAEKLGAPHPGGGHLLPSWEVLAEADPATLKACALGYRASHILESARFIARHPGWLEETEGLPYPAAGARLRTLPGVGPKIADCVLLFGGGRLESFPVDTWIIRAMGDLYGLQGWKPAQITRFGQVHFGEAAGLAQQFLFASMRDQQRKPPRQV